MVGPRWLLRKRILLPIAALLSAVLAAGPLPASAGTGVPLDSWSRSHPNSSHRLYIAIPPAADGAPLPTAATVGVPAQTQLTTFNGTYRATAGETVTAKLITGDFIAAANVTLTNSRVLGPIIIHDSGLSLIDDDIGPAACPSSDGDYELIAGPFSALRVHFHTGVGDDLIRLSAGTTSITDSLVDQPCFYPGNHLDAIQFYDPGTVANVTIRHSVIDVRPVNSTDHGNAAIFWADQPAASSTLTVTGSLLAGGNYTVALYDAGTINVSGNTFVRASTVYGACATNVPIAFTSNTYQDGGAVTC
jgi:hypothetical protein